MIGAREPLIAHRRLRHHRLDESRAVADDQEMELPARPPVVQPAMDGDLLAVVLRDVVYVSAHIQGRGLKVPPRTSQTSFRGAAARSRFVSTHQSDRLNRPP